MECVEGALKNSFIGPKNNNNVNNHHNPLSFSDDLPTVVPGDDFFVDGLLDFSDDGDFEEHNDDNHFCNDTDNDNTLSISPVKIVNHEINPSFSIPEHTDLCLPADDVAEDLEWVSHFVDDSFSGGYSLTCPAGKFPEKKWDPEPSVMPSFTTSVLTKARSKRTRTGGRVWSLGSNPLTDSSTSSSSSSSCTTSNHWRFFQDSTQTAESIFGKKPVRRQKIKKIPSPAAGEPGVQPRRCSHCLVQKTPQWRAGPLGAKTLCNACGVRYKSGRLLPEYRPACSPTFSSEVHSNNHRKVLEMRQKKEAVEPGLALPVQSF